MEARIHDQLYIHPCSLQQPAGGCCNSQLAAGPHREVRAQAWVQSCSVGSDFGVCERNLSSAVGKRCSYPTLFPQSAPSSFQGIHRRLWPIQALLYAVPSHCFPDPPGPSVPSRPSTQPPPSPPGGLWGWSACLMMSDGRVVCCIHGFALEDCIRQSFAQWLCVWMSRLRAYTQMFLEEDLGSEWECAFPARGLTVASNY